MGFSFFTLSTAWLCFSALGFVVAMMQMGSSFQWKKRSWLTQWDQVQRWWNEQQLPVAEWPLLWMGSIALVSAGLVLAWTMVVGPVTWDTLTLYDFRAQRIAEGWPVERFHQQFIGDPDFFLYDFLHPFFSSILFALTYQLGGTQVNLWHGFLLATVWLYGCFLWRTWPGRVLWSLLWWATPLLLETAVAGYGSVYSAAFWGMAFLVLWESRWRPQPAYEWLIGFCVAAAALNRVSEPFWAVFLLWYSYMLGFQEQRLSVRCQRLIRIGLPLMIGVGQWYGVRAQGLQYGTSPDVLRSFGAMSEALPHLLTQVRISVIGDVLGVLMRTPLMAIFVMAVVVVTMIWPLMPAREKRVWYWSGGLLALWVFLLVSGMVALRLWLPASWEEVSKAAPRSVLPIFVLLVVQIVALAEYRVNRSVALQKAKQ